MKDILIDEYVAPIVPHGVHSATECFNVDNLTAIADWLESQPGISFSMVNWSNADITLAELVERVNSEHTCGTSACMVGWAPYALPKHFEHFVNEVYSVIPQVHGIRDFYLEYADHLLTNPEYVTSAYHRTQLSGSLYTNLWDQYSVVVEPGRVMRLDELVRDTVNKQIAPHHVDLSTCSRLAAAWRCRHIISGKFLDISCREYMTEVVPFIVSKVKDIGEQK